MTVIDHSKIRTAPTAADYMVVESASDVVRPGDLVLDGHAGAWCNAADRDLGVKVEKRLGVERKPSTN